MKLQHWTRKPIYRPFNHVLVCLERRTLISHQNNSQTRYHTHTAPCPEDICFRPALSAARLLSAHRHTIDPLQDQTVSLVLTRVSVQMLQLHPSGAVNSGMDEKRQRADSEQTCRTWKSLYRLKMSCSKNGSLTPLVEDWWRTGVCAVCAVQLCHSLRLLNLAAGTLSWR